MSTSISTASVLSVILVSYKLALDLWERNPNAPSVRDSNEKLGVPRPR